MNAKLIKLNVTLTAIGMAAALFFTVAKAATLDDYLIVGRYVDDTAVDASNYELGKISTLDSGNYESVSSPGVGPSTGQTNDARIAILETDGTVKMSDMRMFGTGLTGIDCAGSYNNCTDNGGNLSNTKYNGSNMNGSNGVQGGVNMANIETQIALAQSWISGLGAADVSISTSSGDISSDQVVNLASGLNVVRFSGVGSNDIKVDNSDLIFQGASDAFAVVLVDEGSNFLTSNGNLVIGNGGIGLNNVVIVSTTGGSSANFGLSNTYINGVALWDLGGNTENNMSLDNVIGCTQLIGDDVDIQTFDCPDALLTQRLFPFPRPSGCSDQA